MRPSTPEHPFGHGAPLDDYERARLDTVTQQHAADLGPLLRWPAAAPAATRYRRVLRVSGWPAWAALLLGLVLIDWGARQDQGWPLLAGALLGLTCNHWLALPLLPGPASTGSRSRLWDGPR